MSSATIRPIGPEDLVGLAGLLDEYMVETFRKKWNGSVEGLRRDMLGKEANALIALDEGEPVGFSIYRRTYDAHHCLVGGELLDIYVKQELRGSVFAPLLIHETVSRVAKDGGFFLKGQGVSVQGDRFYDRLAVTFPGTEFILGGRAFRELAGLHGRPLREIIRLMPNRDANFEP
ncbi:MAG: GNAT family N-acetyltransferase [Archangium sp.]